MKLHALRSVQPVVHTSSTRPSLAARPAATSREAATTPPTLAPASRLMSASVGKLVLSAAAPAATPAVDWVRSCTPPSAKRRSFNDACGRVAARQSSERVCNG